jgi:transcriptional regulator with XRE-family HTH domain
VTDTFGERLEAARREQGMKAGILAQRVGITESGLRHIEKGRTAAPNGFLLLRLAEELNLDPYRLAFDRAKRGPGSAAHSEASCLPALDRLLEQTIAQDPHGNNSEDQVRYALRRIARG